MECSDFYFVVVGAQRIGGEIAFPVIEKSTIHDSSQIPQSDPCLHGMSGLYAKLQNNIGWVKIINLQASCRGLDISTSSRFQVGDQKNVFGDYIV